MCCGAVCYVISVLCVDDDRAAIIRCNARRAACVMSVVVVVVVRTVTVTVTVAVVVVVYQTNEYSLHITTKLHMMHQENLFLLRKSQQR